MEKEFIPYEQALELKELGFDEDCFGYYKLQGKELVFREIRNTIISNWRDSFMKFSQCSAPTYQQAFRWLYQKLDIEKGVMPLDIESQQLLLKELIDKVSSKHLLV